MHPSTPSPLLGLLAWVLWVLCTPNFSRRRAGKSEFNTSHYMIMTHLCRTRIYVCDLPSKYESLKEAWKGTPH